MECKNGYMMKALLAGAVAIGTSVSVVRAADVAWDAAKLDKATLCKICHSKDKVGNQWGAWEKSKHSKAFEVLGTPEAKAVGKKLGVDDPQKSGKCLKCHSTAYGFTEERVSEKVKVEMGVTCQTCHGPAKKYKMTHQKHLDKAYAEGGLIKPTEENTCSRCHNENNPTYNKERFTKADGTKTDFDFAQASEKIKHPKPADK